MRNMKSGAKRAFALAVGVFALSACEGENVFETGQIPGGGTNDRVAPTVVIERPDEGGGTALGDSLRVEATLEDNLGVTSVEFEGVSFRGDPTLGTDIVVDRFASKTVEFVDPVTDTLLIRYIQPTGDDAKEIVAIIVTATDVGGNVFADTVNIYVGGPTVEFVGVQNGDQVAVGRAFNVAVHAEDSDAITEIELMVDGAYADTSALALAGAPADTTVNFSFTVPAGTTGQITIQAAARNAAGLRTTGDVLTLNLVTQVISDRTPPQVSLAAFMANRVEVQDFLEIDVSGADDSQGFGIQKIGYTVRATNLSGDSAAIYTDSIVVDPNQTGTRFGDFDVLVSSLNIDPTTLPDTLDLEIVGWMVDAAGNCSASTGGTDQLIICGQLASGERWAVGDAGSVLTGLILSGRVVVSGATITLPSPTGRIADAVIDTARQFVVLANIDDDRLEIFDLETLAFGTAVLVGSEPWGLAWSRTDADTLIVGNSGGTNVSMVYMADSDPDNTARREDVSRRILTPNSLLFEVQEDQTETGLELTVRYFDFSDRPQFVAVDASGRIVYSTKPTDASPNGTIRMADLTLGPDAEIIFYTDYAGLLDADQIVALAQLDDVDDDAIGGVELVDHIPGDRSAVITEAINPADPNPTVAAAGRLATQGSNVEAGFGRWDVAGIGLSDTTFLAAAGNGSNVAIGEGATGPTGRIFLYDAATQRISNVVSVQDLVNNAAERVFGLAMNYDGSMGVARGQQAVYFFTPDLRLQGSPGIDPGGSGAALHPLHTNGPVLTDPNVAFAFVGTGEQSIEIYETLHFSQIGEVFIRDNLAGPLRAALPLASDNVGRTCPTVAIGGVPGNNLAVRVLDAAGNPDPGTDEECTVVKLVGITDQGGVAVINVTKADMVRNHPSRLP